MDLKYSKLDQTCTYLLGFAFFGFIGFFVIVGISILVFNYGLFPNPFLWGVIICGLFGMGLSFTTKYWESPQQKFTKGITE